MMEERERNVPPRNAVIAPRTDVALDMRTRVAMRAGELLLRVLGATWRVRVFGREALLARAIGDPRVVYTLWHGQMLPVVWAHRQPTSVIVSEHRDGEIIARILGRLGFGTVRGSSSRGGARALLEAIQVLKQGIDLAITPDGPRGPRHAYAPGALLAAFRAGAALIPIVAHVDRKWQLRSWDRFEIPKPFARITVLYGTPVVPIAADARAAAELTGMFQQRMLDELERASSLAQGMWSAPLPPVDFGRE
jgi:lysophospholipid acyltransferase (LPLAT)-like uncharacterized protein